MGEVEKDTVLLAIRAKKKSNVTKCNKQCMCNHQKDK